MTAGKFEGYCCPGKGKALEKWAYEPRPLGELDVEIAISHCGICASDIHTLDSGWGPTAYPVIVGHEIAGKVTAVGSKVSDRKVGDRVGVGAQVWSCDECEKCKAGHETFCDRMVFTYNSKYADGKPAYGGYAKAVRVHHSFTFMLPEKLPSDVAAPLLCAGVTVFNPLVRFKAGPGKKVAVLGIGGLGHLAVQFAAKMGADVTAVSHSSNKREQSSKLGAKHFLDISDDKEVKSHIGTFDIMVITSNHKGQPWSKYFSLMAVGGVVCLLAAPEEPISFGASALMKNEVSVVGSLIGPRKRIQEMLDFAAKHDVRPWIETEPLSNVNAALTKVREGKPRYRIVLDTAL